MDLINKEEQEQLNQLFLSTANPDNDIRTQMRIVNNPKITKQKLVEISEKDEFPIYACSTLCDPSNSTQLKFIASVCLKSVLSRSSTSLTSKAKLYLEENLPKAFMVEENLVRKGAKFCIVSLIIRSQIVQSEKMITFLVEAIEQVLE